MAKHSEKSSEAGAAAGGGTGEKGRAGKTWGCLKKFFVGGLVALPVLLWLLNGPVFRWVAEWGIGKGLAGQGMTGSVDVGGTLWGGVEVSDLDFTGDGELLKTVRARQVEVDYDTMGLIKGEGIAALEKVVLKDGTVELELPEKAEAMKEELEEEKPAGGLDELWNLTGLEADIENIDVKVTQGEKVTVVEGLTLKHDGETGEGLLEIAKLELPNGQGREGISTKIKTGEDSLTLGPLRVFDAVEVTSLTLHRNPGDGPLLSAKLDLAGGVVAAEVTAEKALSLSLESGAIDVPRLLEIGSVEGMGSGLVDVFDVDFAGDFAVPSTWVGTAKLAGENVEWAPAVVDRVTLDVVLEGGAATVDLVAERAGARLEVDAVTELGGVESVAGLAAVAVDAELALEVADVAAVLKDYPAEGKEAVPVSGGLAGDGRVRFANKKLVSAAVALDSESLVYGETALGVVTVEVETTDGEVIVADASVVLDEATRVAVKGRYEVLAKAYSGKADVALDLGGRLRALLGEFGFEKMLEGKGTVAWEGRGELESKVHRGKADVALDGARVDEGLEFDVKLDASYDGADVKVGEFTVVSEELRFNGGLEFAGGVLDVSPIGVRDAEREIVSGHVRVPLDLEKVKSAGDFFAQGGEMDVALKSESLPLSSLLRLAGVEPPVTGVLDFDVKLGGPPRSLAGSGSLAVRGVGPVEKGEVEIPPGDVELGFGIGASVLEVTGAVKHPLVEPLEVVATVPFAPEAWATGERDLKQEKLSASVKMAPSDLDFVEDYVEVLEEVEGSLAVDVVVGGTIGAPVATGTAGFELEEVRGSYPSVPPVKDLVVRLRFAERVVEIEEFHGVVAGGRMELAGKVGLPAEGGGPEMDVRITGREALVTRNDELSVRTNLDVSLRGPWASAAVTGKIGITESQYFRNFDLLPVRIPRRDKSVLPEVEKAISAPLPTEVEVSVEAEPFRDWTLDLRVVTDDPFRVRSNLAYTEVAMDVRLTGTLGAPVPNGRIWLDKGEIKLPFSEIRVREGQVVFNEQTGFNPALEFRLTAEVSEYKVTGYIYNRALDPKWVLTSSPPLPQEDILSLLGTGTTREGLTGGGQGQLAKLAGTYLWKSIRKEKYVETDGPTFFEELADRSNLKVEDVNLKTGELTLGGKIRLWEQLYLTGKVGQAGTYRAMLKYIFKFK